MGRTLRFFTVLLLSGYILGGFYGILVASSTHGTTYSLIINTWNDFPNENEKDVEAYPAQALQAYFVLKNKGVQDETIYLMIIHDNTDFIDIDNDGNNDLLKAEIDIENEYVTKETLFKYLQEIAEKVTPYDEVIIFIAGHGEVQNSEHILTFENNQTLSIRELKESINKIKCNQIILLDFCYSGGFLTGLEKSGRTIISASSAESESWYYWDWYSYLDTDNKDIFGDSGSVFFHPFLSKIEENATYEDAYNYAKEKYLLWKDIDEKSGDIIETQNPQLYISEMGNIEKFFKFYPGGEAISGILLSIIFFLFFVNLLWW